MVSWKSLFKNFVFIFPYSELAFSGSELVEELAFSVCVLVENNK
jgi:hypothetical protein